MEVLPSELLRRISYYLNATDLSHLSAACRLFYNELNAQCMILEDPVLTNNVIDEIEDLSEYLWEHHWKYKHFEEYRYDLMSDAFEKSSMNTVNCARGYLKLIDENLIDNVIEISQNYVVDQEAMQLLIDNGVQIWCTKNGFVQVTRASEYF